MPALHAACRDGDIEAVQRLIAKNSSLVNDTDGLKYTPLHYAARKGIIQVRGINIYIYNIGTILLFWVSFFPTYH